MISIFRYRPSKRVFAGLLCCLVISCAQAQTAESKTRIPFFLPYHSTQYPEMAVQLNRALEQAGLGRFEATTADYWHPYQQGIRQGRPGLYLAAPHFAAWVMNKHQFKPVLRLPDKLRYVIAARRRDTQYFEINDLANQAVCSQRAVNLDFLLVRSAFGDSWRAAHNKTVNSVSSAMQYDNENCAAFSVSEHLFKQFNRQTPDRFIRLQQGPEFNNYVFVVHPQINDAQIKSIKSFLRSREAQSILRPLLDEYSAEDVLLPVKAEDYPESYLSTLAPYWR